ncbi:MAG: saccharopine dehydrogenase NADP-binding domain-containing protein [Aquabacterium sp.]|nr:saccharopine dehydrogenase NADP-binding domain-containing protein [Ferruginibacter sp.]
MKKILLFGAGKSATCLIDYLIAEAPANNWIVIIADVNRQQILTKTNHSPFTEAVQADINNDNQRNDLIARADIVISMMPPALHYLIAKGCVAHCKNLLTASYVDDAIKSLQPEIANKNLLFVCEMGLDPGIDHMSAMRIIDSIQENGGSITSFKSHCGGLVAPESDDNPWHYKVSWNPNNITMAGKAGAAYLLNKSLQHKTYQQLFQDCAEVKVEGIGNLAIYPNRDSLSYMPIYHLESIDTFMRTTFRYPAFCLGWDAVVKAGLTDDSNPVNPDGLSFAKWSAPIAPYVNTSNKSLLGFLGIFDKGPVPTTAKTSADILQYLVETKLAMHPHDKDMIVMLHEIEFILSGVTKKIESSLVVKGEDNLRTAMAKTVGLPLGIAAKLILNGTIQLTGLQIPTVKEIYEPVLKVLETGGIRFMERYL